MSESLKAQREMWATGIALMYDLDGEASSKIVAIVRNLQEAAMEALIESEQRRYLEAQRVAAERGDRGCFWQYREWDRSLGQLDELLDGDES